MTSTYPRFCRRHPMVMGNIFSALQNYTTVYDKFGGINRYISVI
jgi:hypothetical protein